MIGQQSATLVVNGRTFTLVGPVAVMAVLAAIHQANLNSLATARIEFNVKKTRRGTMLGLSWYTVAEEGVLVAVVQDGDVRPTNATGAPGFPSARGNE